MNTFEKHNNKKKAILFAVLHNFSNSYYKVCCNTLVLICIHERNGIKEICGCNSILIKLVVHQQFRKQQLIIDCCNKQVPKQRFHFEGRRCYYIFWHAVSTDETSYEAGIKVQIHSQDEPPFIDQLGFGVAPGFQTFVSCQQQLVANDQPLTPFFSRQSH